MRHFVLILVALAFLGCADNPTGMDEPLEKEPIIGQWETSTFKVRFLKFSPETFRSYVLFPTGPQTENCFVVNEFEVEEVTDTKVIYKGADSPLLYRAQSQSRVDVAFGRFGFVPFQRSQRNLAGLNLCGE